LSILKPPEAIIRRASELELVISFSVNKLGKCTSPSDMYASGITSGIFLLIVISLKLCSA
jgi:hypothetical protein